MSIPSAKSTSFIIFTLVLFASPLCAQFVIAGPRLIASDAVGQANQGAALAISADGNTAVIGAPQDNGGLGCAWVWTRSNGVWSQQAKLVGSDYVGPSGQGAAVAISADGTDGRAAELKFSRSTEYRGDVGATPQDPALKPPLPDNL